MIALAATLGLRVWSIDVKLAFLQSTEPLHRRIFIRNPAEESRFEPEQCFELLRPIYGLADAGDLCHVTMDKHLIDDLQMEQSKSDPSLYFHFDSDKLIGVKGTYVDYLLPCGKKNSR